MKGCLGRKKIIDQLVSLLCEGETVLVYGPRGIGKSAILHEVMRKVRADGRRCTVCPETGTFQDVTFGLEEMYPEVHLADRNHRRIRNAFRLAIEAAPGVLILDHYTTAGTAMKGFLRHLRRSGLGILIAADAEHDRDHARLRGMGLCHREVQVPPLPPRHIRALFEDALAGTQLPHALDEASIIALVDATRGRPGRMQPILERLATPRYWSNGKVLFDLLEMDVAIEAAR